MYRFYEDFKAHTDDNSAYNVYVERSTTYEHNHGKVEEDKYSLNCSGNNHLFITPNLKNFSVKTTVKITETSLSLAAQDRNIFKECGWTFIFDYDPVSRQGKKLLMEYKLNGKLEISVMNVDGVKEEIIETRSYPGVILNVDEEYEFEATFADEKVFGKFAGSEFNFTIADRKKGRVGLSRINYAGKAVFGPVEILADEVATKTVVPKFEVALPLTYGGNIPYRLSFEIVKQDDVNTVKYSLSGGVSTRNPKAPRCDGKFSVCVEHLDGVYLRLMKGEKSATIYIKNGQICSIDPHAHWKYLVEYFGVTQLPLSKSVAIDELFASKDIKIAVGFACYHSKGYNFQRGEDVEFIYDTKGNLLYDGGKLTKTSYEVVSPDEKQVLKKVPVDLPEYDNVIQHIKDNHYFMPGEEINLALNMRTNLNFDEITASATLCDVYGTPICEDVAVSSKVKTTNFLDTEINIYEYAVKINPLEAKLYRIIFYVYEGDTLIETKESVFEVVSSDIPAPKLSGLPFMYSTPTEQKYIDRDAFDMYAPVRDCNFEHYYTCSAFEPTVGIEKRVYDINKVFGRKWFMWFNNRTVEDYTNYEKYMDGIKNADYITAGSFRADLHRPEMYNLPGHRKILQEFVKDFPQYEGLVDVSDEHKFTNDDLATLMNVCKGDWLDYYSKKNMQNFKEFVDMYKTMNPNFKRVYYGPFSLYGCPVASYYMMKASGLNPNEDISKLQEGFYQFEDYSHTCAYHTYRSAFAMMSLKLYQPNLDFHPEMYTGDYLCCADGNFSYARPPLAADIHYPSYYHVTKAYEYVFSTAHKYSNGSYGYWRDYGFMLRDSRREYLETFVKSWKYVHEYNPEKPLKTFAFVTDYPDSETIIDRQLTDLHGWDLFYNRSECSQSFVYSVSREAGYPAGYALKNDTIKLLTADETDVLVLSSTKDLDKETLEHIRTLYNGGVGLIAVSDVTGLEDLFGVKESKQTVRTDTLYYGDEEESVYPLDIEYLYEPTDAEVVVKGNDAPAILKNGRAILINAPATMLGVDSYTRRVQFSRESISLLTRKALADVLKEITNPVVKGNGCGVSAFTTRNGKTALVLFNYSSHYMETEMAEVTVDINIPGVKDIISETKFTKFTKDGNIYKIKTTLPPKRTAVIELVK